MDAAEGQKSLVKVVDPAPQQLPSPDSIARALDVLKCAKRPLIILGKGAAYAQEDEIVRSFVEKSGVPYLPMSMAKGLLPDDHPQSAGAARSLVLKEADVVVMVGARLNWLLSHGKGKSWGEPGSKRFIQVDIEPREMDSNVEIAAPVVGDIGSCLSAMSKAMGDKWPAVPADWIANIQTRKDVNLEKMSAKLMSNTVPMDFHSALGALRTIVKQRPDAILVNEGANTLDFARSIIDVFKPRKRLDVGTWGIMGIGMGAAVAAAVETIVRSAPSALWKSIGTVLLISLADIFSRFTSLRVWILAIQSAGTAGHLSPIALVMALKQDPISPTTGAAISTLLSISRGSIST
jgi:oxalyl-CoA decarboxylase